MRALEEEWITPDLRNLALNEVMRPLVFLSKIQALLFEPAAALARLTIVSLPWTEVIASVRAALFAWCELHGKSHGSQMLVSAVHNRWLHRSVLVQAPKPFLMLMSLGLSDV